MNVSLFSTLALAAITVGVLHTLAPDHWIPIAAVSRARGWTQPRTIRVALLCGFGHVTVSALLGLLALFSETRLVDRIGAHSASVAGYVLVGFGVAYALWGARRLIHGHAHHHARDASKASTWTLFAIYCADPCIAVVPIIFAAATLSTAATIVLVLLYEVATIATMVGLTVAARAGSAKIRGHWVDRYGDSAAGALIAVTGVAVALLGI